MAFEQQTQVTPAPNSMPVPGEAAGMAAAGFPGMATAAAPLPDLYGDDLELKKLFKECRDLAFDQRWLYERLWWRNILYVLNRQWIWYNPTRNAWQDKRMAKWVPRPVTNKLAEGVQAIRSVFSAVELGAKCRPAGDDPKDVQTAETADRMEPAIAAEHEIRQRFHEGDFWLSTTGNVFYHPWFDKRQEHGALLVPYERCTVCTTVSAPDIIEKAGNVCPECGQMAFEPAMDEDDQPLGQTYAIGRGTTDVCSPLEIGLPPSYSSFAEVPWLLRMRWRAKSWYEKNHADLAKTLHFDKSPQERSLQLLRAVASQSDIQGATLGAMNSEGQQAEGIVEYELWLKPTPKYPRGLLLRCVGEKGQETVLRIPEENLPGPLPNNTVNGQPWFPWIHVAYENIGGRVWGRSPLDLVIQKQDQINQLDSMVQLIVQRMANPVWLEPKGAEVKRFTGEPGLVVRWNPLVGAGNAKPERIEGSNIPNSIIQLRQQYVSDLEAGLGTSDVLKGTKPAGIEAFSAMQLLVERAQSRFGPVLAARGEAYRQWYTMALELEREHGPIERTWAALGANRKWTFENFKNANLWGSITVIVEDGSQAPKTNLGDRAAIEHLNQLGFIDPTDTDQKVAIYEAFGQTRLLPALNAHVKAALQEQDAFTKWANSPGSQPMPIMPGAGAVMNPHTGAMVDPATGADMPPQYLQPSPMVRKIWNNDDVHVAEHTKWANSDEARQLFAQRPDVEQAFTMHLMEHQQAIMQAAMQAAMTAAPGPGGKPGGGAGRAMANSNQESGKPGVNQAPPA
jgi:hypothetical protein